MLQKYFAIRRQLANAWLPLPEDETSWDKLQVLFATTSGDVRRNELSDFANIHKTGKIAMKLDEGDGIVDVQMCTEMDDVLLTTAKGQCIRFPVTDVRVFKGRDSTGVRGILLGKDDKVISMTILNAFDATAEERAGYLKMRRAVTGESEENGDFALSDALEHQATPEMRPSTSSLVTMPSVRPLSVTRSGR